MHILIAPDKFKDALDARRVAEAIATGVRAARPDATLTLCPLGDGGEGTAEILAARCAASEQRTRVLDPLARPRAARWWRDTRNNEALVEMAEASGLALLSPGERDPTATTSFGTGELIRAAVEAGCATVTLCVGGSATVDGGAGCLQALGWRFHDGEQALIDRPLTGGRLGEVAALRAPPTGIGAAVRVLCDVRNPLLGERGAAHVFAAQKGATADQIEQLERNMRHWGALLEQATKTEVSALVGAGAAGGLPAALYAAADAELIGGFDETAQRVGLHDLIAAADLVITGEGRLDAQTAEGKVVAGVARLARRANRPALALVGAVSQPGLQEQLGLAAVHVISPQPGVGGRTLRETEENLRRTAAMILREMD